MKVLKNIFLALLVSVFAMQAASAKALKALQITQASTNSLVQIPYEDITRTLFRDDSLVVVTKYGDYTLATADVRQMTYASVSDPLAVSINYSEDGAVVTNPLAHRGVTLEQQGAYVTLTSAITDQEISVTLSGATADGAFTYNGDYKMTLNLQGVSITSRQGAAVNILCGKRIAVNLIEGTVSTLADSSEGEQKAALYFKGHPEFTGAGTLNVTGNCKHAISTNEYMQLKKKCGTINILASQKDGIHAGQYFQMNGGTVTIRNVQDDGIQTEATSDTADELNGQLIINGGTLDIQCDADGYVTDDSTATDDGTTTPTVPGGGGGGRPGGGGFPGGGGGFPGGGGVDVETTCASCLKADSLCTILGGNLTLKATGKGGKCIKADYDLVIGEAGADGPVISATTTGTVVTGSGENLSGQPKAIKADGNLTVNSGSIHAKTQSNGGEGIECKAYLTFNGGTTICETYDDGINAQSKITVNDGFIYAHSTGNDGMDCNGQEGFEFNGGVALCSGTRAPEEGFDCDRYSFVINGGTLIGTGGATSSPTKAAQPFKSVSNQSLTAGKYLALQKSDGTLICAYRIPATLSGATLLVSSPQFQSGQSYKLVRNATATANDDTAFDGKFFTDGTISGGTTTTFTPTTK